MFVVHRKILTYWEIKHDMDLYTIISKSILLNGFFKFIIYGDKYNDSIGYF